MSDANKPEKAAGSWWQIMVEKPDLESEVFEIAAQFAPECEGVEVHSENSASLFFKSGGSRPLKLINYLDDHGFTLKGCDQLEDRNWQADFQREWTSIEVDGIRIMPIVEGAQKAVASPADIYLVPGAGFGTGVSPTTQLALRLIVDLEKRRAKIARALDVGTGSAVLSIAAAQKFPGAQLTGVDICEMAIENARENIALNDLSSRIEVSTTPVSKVGGEFELVVGNLEIGYQLDLMSDYARLTGKGGYLILSGIRDCVRGEQMVRLLQASAPDSSAWKVLSTVESGDWRGFLIERTR
jgi:ribosomal protein L11 methylase PrmA